MKKSKDKEEHVKKRYQSDHSDQQNDWVTTVYLSREIYQNLAY